MSLNYRPLLDSKLEEFKKKMPKYTFAQTVYTALNEIVSTQDFKKSDLLRISDEKMYQAVCKAIEAEEEN